MYIIRYELIHITYITARGFFSPALKILHVKTMIVPKDKWSCMSSCAEETSASKSPVYYTVSVMLKIYK